MQHKTWEELHNTYSWSKEPGPFFKRFYETRYEGTKGLTFLDLGCGTGASSLYLAEKGHKVYAIDSVQAALSRMVASAADKSDLQLYITTGDVRDLSVKPETIDCVIDRCCLQHLPLKDAEAVIQKSRKWLKPKGRFYSEMATEPFDMAVSRGTFLRLITKQEIRQLFQGFSGDFIMYGYDVKLTPDDQDRRVTHFSTDAELLNERSAG